MAFKDILTPFVANDTEQTLAEFMNMKFEELLGNTKDNRDKISILYTHYIGANIDANTLITEVEGWVSSGTNFPNANPFEIRVKVINDYWIYQEVIELGNRKKFFRFRQNNVWDTKWTENATTDKIDISLTLLNGFINTGWGTSFATKCNDVVTVGLYLNPANASLSSGTIICILPVDFRPRRTLYHVPIGGPSTGKVFLVTINADGSIVVPGVPFEASVYIAGTLTFVR